MKNKISDQVNRQIRKKESRHEDKLLCSGIFMSALIFVSFLAWIITGLDSNIFLGFICVGAAGWFLATYLYFVSQE
jgi:hypothetical protein